MSRFEISSSHCQALAIADDRDAPRLSVVSGWGYKQLKAIGILVARVSILVQNVSYRNRSLFSVVQPFISIFCPTNY